MNFQVGDIVRLVRPWSLGGDMPGDYEWNITCGECVGLSGYIREIEDYLDGKICSVRFFSPNKPTTKIGVHESMLELESDIERINYIQTKIEE